MTKRVFVANLSKQVTVEDLTAEFSKCGTVAKCNLVFDVDTKRSKGYGFVEFGSTAEAQVAIQALNNTTLKGRVIEVTLAKARV